jgi:hypothetical protein
MPTTRQGRLTAMVASAALASAGLLLAASAATAAPVFTDADTSLDPGANAYTAGGTCPVAPTFGPTTSVPVIENGASATATTSVSATFTNSGDGTDNASGAASETATGSVKSVGGTLKSMDFTGSGTASIDQALATSACGRAIYAYVDLNFTFTLAQAGYLHVTMSNSGAASYGEVYLYQTAGNQPYVDHYGSGLKFSGTDDVFLPAGEYAGRFEADGSSNGLRTTDFSGTSKTTVHASFAVAGSQTAAQTGNGTKYVAFAGARTCATHSLGASVTHRKKLAHRIRKISFFVNGTKVRTVRTPHKGLVVTLPIADDQAANVLAKVKLFPSNGKPARVVQTTASYEACS